MPRNLEKFNAYNIDIDEKKKKQKIALKIII